jgi:hypothetical protein
MSRLARQDRRSKPEMNRTTKAQWFCTPTQPRPAYPSKQEKQRTQANPLAHSTMKPRPTAGGVLKEKARATSAIEYQIRGHGCGVVVLNAIEEHITAEQDDCQQAISKIGRLSGPVIAHFAGILVLANRPLSSLWPSLLVELQRRLRTPWRVNSPYSWRQRSSRIH